MNPSIRSALTRRAVLAAGVAAVPLLAGRPASAAGTFPDPGPNVPTQATLGYADMIRELRRIERSSRFGVEVTTLRELGITPGVSEAGRDLYVATVGTGAKHVWLQGRIHGNEPYGVDTLLTLLSTVGSSGAAGYRAIREALTLHVIPMYNPDGTELNIRHTVLQDGTERRIDLNRDWAPTAFAAKESVSWYTYWTRVKPAFGLDIHHQGLKTDADGDAVTMSLGISLAPSGPTLPTVLGGLYDRQTRQAQGLVYTSLQRYGFVSVDRYSVGSYEIDILGGVSSAVMVGLNWNGLNPTGHSHPMVFFETSGNTSAGSVGQKARGKAIRQNVIGASELLQGLATGSVWNTDRMIWHEQIPHVDYTGYFSDNNVVITPWPTRPPL
ncbi:M14 family zinc carboxypeptidase [Humibacillus xanthopallidus]|uniref:Zinc carboxypeptidase n=1 Tax=Humibacillus xanthopallidus TaxID=412689 RepID=A0A543I2R0_9MICO|nr:M14 family zinc carboxypeptidase [Humibacillus xanthopallidus]TQM64884.1 zinc carboxypeptidase [Humibacillus xanthopallidus]